MNTLEESDLTQIKGGDDWPNGTLCFFAPAGWISSRGRITSGIWDVVAKECWNS